MKAFKKGKCVPSKPSKNIIVCNCNNYEQCLLMMDVNAVVKQLFFIQLVLEKAALCIYHFDSACRG